MKNICVIGSSNVDLIMQMDRLPEVGETVTEGKFMQTFGGKGANTAVAAARAGGNIQFVNCVGDDAYSPEMVEMFKNEGMDISLLGIEKGISSGTALIMIGKDGSNCISVAPGANYALTPERIEAMEDELKEATRILLQCEIPLETNVRVIELASKYDIPVMLNLAPARDMPWESLCLVDCLIVNENEARFLAERQGVKIDQDADLAEGLVRLGAQKVIVTLGADGAVLATGEGIHRIPAFVVDAVDSTAAGDTFCGALSVALVEGKSMPEAMRFATAASAVCVGRLGAIPSIPNREEIDAFLALQSS